MSIQASIKLSGDWKAFENFLSYKWKSELERAMDQAAGQAAYYILSQIRGKIRDKRYKSNALSTARGKGFTTPAEATPLVDSGDLLTKALVVNKLRQWYWEVGVIGNIGASNSKGKKTLKEIVPILHEGGTIVQTRGNKRVIIRIPSRPFLSSVWENPKVLSKIDKIWQTEVQRILKKHGKL